MIVFLLLWNFGISWLNCWFVGKTWAESKAVGGWTRLVTWSAAVMGACGFVWCNLLVIGYAASTHVGILPHKYQLTDPYLELLWEMGYAIVIFPILGSGLAIWADSLKQAYKNRDMLSVGVAGYNTFAMAHNAYEAAEFLPTVFEKIGNSLEDSDNKAAMLVIYTVLALSVGIGVGLAYYIIHTTAVGVANKARSWRESKFEEINLTRRDTMMKKYAAIVLSLMMFALPVLATQNFPLTTPFNGPVFSAMYPTPDNSSVGVEKSLAEGTTTNNDGTYTGYTYGSTTKNGKAWFGAGYLDYTSVRGTSVDVLDKAVDGGIAGMKLVLVPDSRKNTELAGLFAREGEGVDDTSDSFLRVSVTGNRCYLAIVVFDKSLHATQADADEFFNSIHRN
jgi:hypothetical protein